jgi:hypothetical protein
MILTTLALTAVLSHISSEMSESNTASSAANCTLICNESGFHCILVGPGGPNQIYIEVDDDPEEISKKYKEFECAGEPNYLVY